MKMMKKTVSNEHKKGRKFDTILGVRIDSTELVEVLRNVRYLISHNNKFYIVTPNPELVLMAKEDRELLGIVNSADFALPDGVGLRYASKFLYGRDLKIVPGRKLFLELIGLANKKGWKVFFLGGEGEEAKLSAKKLRLSYKKIKIETFNGPRVDESGEPVSEVDDSIQENAKRKLGNELNADMPFSVRERHSATQSDAIKRINDFRPQLLFVAFGMPKQEYWIAKNIKRLDIGGTMAVGGTFRYIAGLSKLPPKWMENAGLEWLWRLITEPWRAKRIFMAFPIFPLKVFWYKLRN